MADTESDGLRCRACRHVLGVPGSATCSECGLLHEVGTSTSRDRLPALRAAWFMLALAVFSCIALVSMQLEDHAALKAMSDAAVEQRDAVQKLREAIIDDESTNLSRDKPRAWKAQVELFAHPPRPVPALQRWPGYRDPGLAGGEIASAFAALFAAYLVFVTYMRRFGEVTAADARWRRRAAMGWACLLLAAWVLVVFS